MRVGNANLFSAPDAAAVGAVGAVGASGHRARAAFNPLPPSALNSSEEGGEGGEVKGLLAHLLTPPRAGRRRPQGHICASL